MGKQALVALPVCVALAGCGGGTRAERPAPSRPSFAAQADRICTQATTQSGRVARLRSLQPPARDEDLYMRWMRAEESALEAAEIVRNPPDDAEGDLLVPLVIAEGKIAGYARRLGAQACAAVPAGRMPP